MIRSLVVPLALLASSACAYTPEQEAARRIGAGEELADAIGDRMAGPVENCIDPGMQNGPQVVYPDTVIYRESASRLWVSKVEGCPSLRAQSTLIVDIYGTNLCRNDRFRTIEPGQSIPSGYCRFGPFQRFDRPER